MKNTPHPIQYQGSKRNLASAILHYLLKDIDCLIEPFAGSAAISIAAAERQLAKKYWINDLNKPLSDLLQMIVESPAEIASFYEEVWNAQHDNSLEHYYKIRQEFNQTKGSSRVLVELLKPSGGCEVNRLIRRQDRVA
jgi:DNA adenine methylase